MVEKPGTEREPSSACGGVSRATRLRGPKVSGRRPPARPPVKMEGKADRDISRKSSQFPTDGCSIEFGTFDKHGFIYIPPCTGEQCQSAPGTGDSAAATQASSLQESNSPDKIAPAGDAPPGKCEAQKTPITKDPVESVGRVIVDKHGFVYVPPCIEELSQSAPGNEDCAAATQPPSLQESDSPDKIAPPGEGEVQEMPIIKEPDESAGDVIADKLTKPELDVDSPEIMTGGFPRAKLMDNLRCLVEINKTSKGMRRKKRKTSGEQAT